MPTEIYDENVQQALDEIERSEKPGDVPLEQRGGEVLEQVNDVFNLMGMKIKMNADARSTTAE